MYFVLYQQVRAVYLDASGNTVNAAGQGFAIAMAVAL